MATKTKAKPAEKSSSSRAVATQPKSGFSISKEAPTDQRELAKMSGGQGLSKSQSDNLIPLIYVLQAQSPQVLKKNAKYVDGAEAGDIWLRSAAEPIIKGEEGMLFQACAYYKEWVEWVPRDDGGGFVGRFACTLPEHDDTPPVKDAEQYEDEKDDGAGFMRWRRKSSGNDLIFTRYYIGYVLRGNNPVPYVVPFSSTGHTIAKDWMTKMNTMELPNGEQANIWCGAWQMTVGPKSNKKGDWFGWNIEFAGWISGPQLDKGAALARAFEKKEVRIEEPEERTGGEGGSGGKSNRM